MPAGAWWPSPTPAPLIGPDAFGGDTVPAGWPDITGLLPDGRFIGVEVKAPAGRQSPVQKQMEQEIRKRNGIYVLARSVEDVQKGIEDAC